MEQDADPSINRTQTTETSSPENIDALLEAARYDDIEDVISLASAGVPLDSKDSQGRSALHMASANGHLGIVEYLIGRGVQSAICSTADTVEGEMDVNASNEEKNTPLHYACLNGHTEVAKKLVLSGANISVLNSHEQTPIDEALSSGKMDIIDAINTAVAQLELGGVTVS